MRLKEYQNRILNELDTFLDNLNDERSERDKLLSKTPEEAREAVASSVDFIQNAWNKSKTTKYHPKRDGLNKPLPDVYLKVPTGGGKTFLACHAVDRIHRKYLYRESGLVVWIVPTNQIYRQTLAQLRDRSHPYRQLLEVTSGGRVKIAERKDGLSPADVSGKLTILLLMLPAANRQTKEKLRMYRDSGGYEAFFPDDGNVEAHGELLEQTPNLDAFNNDNGLLPPIVKSSLANVFRIFRPLIVVDEGQKAYSNQARETICGFNPSFVLELSATPPANVNLVSSATGHDLNEEEMIKLDINLTNKNTPDWGIVLLAVMEKRKELEQKTDRYRQNSSRNIRPIALIQVERVGADQRRSGHIHAEDAREFLLQNGIAENWIAIKTSEKDDLEGIDLLDEECPIRFIITKQALQEGWDCSFAYILAVLSNLSATVSMTQLIGRVLRQPDAQKTGIAALDQCYVFTHRKNSGEVVQIIKKELENEGLGDLSGHISNETGGKDPTPLVTARLRDHFKKFEGRLYLPQFVVKDGTKLRPLKYEGDILANLDWENLRLKGLGKINLGNGNGSGTKVVGLPDVAVQERKEDEPDDIVSKPDSVLMTRQITDVVPNPWDAYKQSRRILDFFIKRDGKEKTFANFVFIIEESKKLLEIERDKMAETYFRSQVGKGVFELLLLSGEGEWKIPNTVTVRSTKRMNRLDGNPLRKSLFDYVPDEDMNEYEKSVALYLDEQERLLWWYRNHTHGGYKLQGWKRNRISPDFITASDNGKGDMGEVCVIETKGIHLKNEDTDYKQSVLDLCDNLCQNIGKGQKRKWSELGQDFADNQFRFNLVFGDDWKSILNGIFVDSAN